VPDRSQHQRGMKATERRSCAVEDHTGAGVDEPTVPRVVDYHIVSVQGTVQFPRQVDPPADVGEPSAPPPPVVYGSPEAAERPDGLRVLKLGRVEPSQWRGTFGVWLEHQQVVAILRHAQRQYGQVAFEASRLDDESYQEKIAQRPRAPPLSPAQDEITSALCFQPEAPRQDLPLRPRGGRNEMARQRDQTSFTDYYRRTHPLLLTVVPVHGLLSVKGI
jgi:hypothetical protein